MKKGINWIGWKGAKSRHYRQNLTIWILGFLILNSSGLFTALAVKRLPPQEVSAFAGFGILVMILLSRLLLNERLYISDIPGAAMIIAAISLLGMNTMPDNASIWNKLGLAPLIPILLLPLLFLLAGIILKKGSCTAYSIGSGSASGLLVILLKILVAHHGFDLQAFFSSPYLYLYIMYALLSLFCLQMALKKGPMMQVGPLQYSSLILYPALCVPLLGGSIFFMHAPLFLISAAGIWIIMRKR